MQNDDKQEKKKLTLTVRNLQTLETRASPNTACPEGLGAMPGGCCQTSALQAAKLTAVAYF